MKKTCTKYAIHKQGTSIFGSLCSYKDEAQALLDDLHKNILNMPEEEKSKYHVAKVELSWDED